MNKILELPYEFVEWYWAEHSTGEESESYVQWDKTPDMEFPPKDLILKETKNWFLKSGNERKLKSWLTNWMEAEEKRYNRLKNQYDDLMEKMEDV